MSATSAVPVVKPTTVPYPCVKIHRVPGGNEEFIVKVMKARPNPKNPTKWEFKEAGLSIRFHGPKKGVQKFSGKRNGRKVYGPTVHMPGGHLNLWAAIEAAIGAFTVE